MSARGSKKAGTHRMDGAIAALSPLGFSKSLIRGTVKELMKVYGDSDAAWYFIEENYYRLVIDTIMEKQDEEKEMKCVKLEEEEQKALTIANAPGTCGKALLELGEDSQLKAITQAPHNEANTMAKKPGERQLAEAADFEPNQTHLSVQPRRRPCYGWISEEED